MKTNLKITFFQADNEMSVEDLMVKYRKTPPQPSEDKMEIDSDDEDSKLRFNI